MCVHVQYEHRRKRGGRGGEEVVEGEGGDNHGSRPVLTYSRETNANTALAKPPGPSGHIRWPTFQGTYGRYRRYLTFTYSEAAGTCSSSLLVQGQLLPCQ